VKSEVDYILSAIVKKREEREEKNHYFPPLHEFEKSLCIVKPKHFSEGSVTYIPRDLYPVEKQSRMSIK
jgi:hypothetical protein